LIAAHGEGLPISLNIFDVGSRNAAGGQVFAVL
jgi:hypothetical protein